MNSKGNGMSKWITIETNLQTTKLQKHRCELTSQQQHTVVIKHVKQLGCHLKPNHESYDLAASPFFVCVD